MNCHSPIVAWAPRPRVAKVARGRGALATGRFAHSLFPDAIRQAFTLLELLLAMALAAMLALTLFTAMNSAIKARRTAQQTVMLTRAGAVAMDLLCRDLESAVPPASSEITNYIPLAGPFQGTRRGGGSAEADELYFYAIDRNHHADITDPLQEGVCAISIYIDTNSTPPALVRRVNRNLLATVQTEAEPELLCRGVRSFSALYYDGTTWLSDWDSSQLGDVLPFAVQLRLVVDDPHAPQQSAGVPGVHVITRTVQLSCAKLPPTEEQ